MNKLKSNSGITLVILAITIVIMLILAGFIIPTGIEQITYSRNKKLLAEVGIVNYALYERYSSYNKTKDPAFLTGEIVPTEVVQQIASSMGITLVTIPDSYNEEVRAYYRLTPNDAKKIGITKAVDTFIVNYLTGEVINETRKTTSDGQPLYVYSKSIFD
jgi:Tfp pilus assembly protein PilE